jgi:hypothetical protein
MGTVVEMYPGALNIAGPEEVIDPDKILENNKGRFSKVFIIGVASDDEELILIGSHNITDMYIHLGLAKREIEDIATGKK